MTENESGKGGLFTPEELFVFLQLIMGENGVGPVLLKLEKYYFDGVASAVDAALENYFEDINYQETTNSIDERLATIEKSVLKIKKQSPVGVKFEKRITEIETNTMEVKNLLVELIVFLDKDRKNGVRTILRKREPRIEKTQLDRKKTSSVKDKKDKKLTGITSYIVALVETFPKGISVQKVQESCIAAGYLKKYESENPPEKARKLFNKAVSNSLNHSATAGRIQYKKKKKLYFPPEKK